VAAETTERKAEERGWEKFDTALSTVAQTGEA